jgi:DNA-binding NarL/FixJ family response regulator
MRLASVSGFGSLPHRGGASRTAAESEASDNSVRVGASVLIVDDHAGFRAHARRLLEFEGYRVVGEAADSSSALEVARALEPELALVDVHLPDANGFELTAWLGTLPDPPAVVLTSSRDGAGLETCVSECGARGFVPKSELSREAIEEQLR